MTLLPPFSIGPRLLPSLLVGNGRLSMECIGVRLDRLVWRTYIDITDPETGEVAEYTDDAITSPRDDIQAAFCTLLSFLSAAAESLHYVECHHNDDAYLGDDCEAAFLFPRAVVEWARRWDNEISALSCDLQESGAVYIKESTDDIS
jgi:hypothetical protein